jgi:hypothetical protein
MLTSQHLGQAEGDQQDSDQIEAKVRHAIA